MPDDVIVFWFDVVKLYPSIPRKEGIDASKEALEKRRYPGIPSKAVIGMIETVLDSNVFHFNNKEYLQTKGVAIGSKLGRNVAFTYMR